MNMHPEFNQISDGAGFSRENANKANRKGLMPIHTAAKDGDNNQINHLLKAGAEIDARERLSGRTALHYAAMHGNLDTISFLVECGADPNATNHTGLSALHFAVLFKQKQAIAVLLKHGTNPCIKDLHKKETAIDMALAYSYHDMAGLMLENTSLRHTHRVKALHHLKPRP